MSTTPPILPGYSPPAYVELSPGRWCGHYAYGVRQDWADYQRTQRDQAKYPYDYSAQTHQAYRGICLAQYQPETPFRQDLVDLLRHLPWSPDAQLLWSQHTLHPATVFVLAPFTTPDELEVGAAAPVEQQETLRQDSIARQLTMVQSCLHQQGRQQTDDSRPTLSGPAMVLHQGAVFLETAPPFQNMVFLSYPLNEQHGLYGPPIENLQPLDQSPRPQLALNLTLVLLRGPHGLGPVQASPPLVTTDWHLSATMTWAPVIPAAGSIPLRGGVRPAYLRPTLPPVYRTRPMSSPLHPWELCCHSENSFQAELDLEHWAQADRRQWETLLAAYRRDPYDPLTRAALADCLEEHALAPLFREALRLPSRHERDVCRLEEAARS